MKLQENIQRIHEVMGVKFSNRFKRKMSTVDRLIDSVIQDSMYPCDYGDEEEFYQGLISELSWLVRDENFGVNDVDWLDIYDYISNFKEEELKEYYRERCNNDNV